MTQTISILGCGWLGFPLAVKLAASGYKVKGSTTTRSKISVLENSNIFPYHLTCTPSVEGGDVADFFKSDVLFVNIPFRRDLKDPRYYLQQLDSVAAHAGNSGVRRIILASSTAVYPAVNRTFHETDEFMPADERAEVLLTAERRLMDDRRWSCIVLRFAGLYGPGRDIGQFFKTGRIPKDPDAPVNLIHLEDCIGIIKAVIERAIRGEVFNACSDGHPSRRELYTEAARAAGAPAPVFDTSAAARGFKIIDNRKLKDVLGYRFKHPDPLAWVKHH